MIRRTALILAATAVVIGAGCASRTTTIPGAYTEGGVGTAFYAEVPYAQKEGAKPRIYLFGKIAHYDTFLATKEIPENAHKKFIGAGANRETIVVQDLVGFELKDNPKYTEKLLAKYQARHPKPAVVEEAPAAAAPAAAPAAPAAPDAAK